MLVPGLITRNIDTVSKGLDASFSGMSGLGHIIITFMLMYFFK